MDIDKSEKDLLNKEVLMWRENYFLQFQEVQNVYKEKFIYHSFIEMPSEKFMQKTPYQWIKFLGDLYESKPS